ncbi:hypothetical protein OG271_03800 [Micromonospora rifamycinica]|uniref:hypothetical protein n=1 Tax=Micromonospora rifamycinica TaxID=291594 RepID=UPI002E2BB438|nr:hypothetical protein [Micromonospora rifamycinica]
MSPAQLAAEQVVLGHLAASLPDLTDAELDAVAAEHAVEQGHYATEARRLLTAELDRRHPVADPTPDPDLPPVRPLGPIPGTSGRPGPDVAPRGWPLTAATEATTPAPFALADDDLFPTATDPALDGYTPPGIDDLGLTADPVALVVSLRKQVATAQARIAELIAGMTEQELDDLAQYEPARHLRAVA